MANTEAKNFLSHRTVGELVFDKRKLIQVDSNDKVVDVCTKMMFENIRSCPVYNSEKKEYVGVVDMMDVIIPLAFTNYFENQTVEQAQFSAYKALSTSVGDIVGLNPEGSRLWIYEGVTPIIETLRPLALGIHRVLVTAKDDFDRHEVYRVLSQTDVVRFLLRNASCLGGLLKTRVDELGLVSGNVETITTKDIAIEGFRKMVRSQVLGLAIVDDEGRIVGSLSSSDVRGLTPAKLKNVILPVPEYLRNVTGAPAAHPITCTAHDSLEEVMLKAIAGKVHRVFVVDASQKPIGVITLSDIIKQFL
eukprot:CAMPEP_0177652176 /NCGR_PEP_ID=MMETSP0447-20121125/12969_1 /TAXON_ID=0 /ORGANISM="Stygamoeba regulata, Strain BSH-02190019" /LENGTH=304 /DNA_ID=CAMNT_0019155361 /DNA_START=64 /DNA_END=978 /DNA_ORIENTATION=-